MKNATIFLIILFLFLGSFFGAPAVAQTNAEPPDNVNPSVSIIPLLLGDPDPFDGKGILTYEEMGYLTAPERAEIFLLNGAGLLDKGLQNIRQREILKAKAYFKVAATKFEGDNTNSGQTAWFFRALTRVAALAFDSAADGDEDGLEDIGDILDAAGYPTDPAQRNPFNYKIINRPAALASNSPRGLDIQQFNYTVVLPELKGAIEDLKKVYESFNARWIEPLDSTTVESDFGDVLAFRSALKAAVAGILIQYAYNVDFDVDYEYNTYYASTNTAKGFLTRNPNVGKLSVLKDLQSSKSYLNAAATDALSAINWIQKETDDQSDDYVSLRSATAEEIRETKTKLAAFKKSLYGATTVDDGGTPSYAVDDTVIDASKAFSGPNLRSFLPAFIGNVPTGFFPDPTFNGVLITYSGNPASKLNENLNGNATADILDIVPQNLDVWYWSGTAFIDWKKVNWDMLKVATAYNLYWATSPGVTKSSNKINTTDNWVYQTGLTIGTYYYYRVAAVTAAGEGPLSEEEVLYAW